MTLIKYVASSIFFIRTFYVFILFLYVLIKFQMKKD